MKFEMGVRRRKNRHEKSRKRRDFFVSLRLLFMNWMVVEIHALSAFFL